MNGTYEEALAFAYSHHGHTTRAGGEPYILHLLRTAQRVEEVCRRYDYTFGPVSTLQMKKVAALHDVLDDIAEDCKDLVLDEIATRFGTEVSERVWILSRQPGKGDYSAVSLLVCSRQLDVLLVKKADLEDTASRQGSTPALQRSLTRITMAMEKALGD
jgi:(p)ppGpp synthase/HD superfamily hydrolase